MAALIVPALAFTLAVLAQRYALLNWRHGCSILAFPAAWTSYEFLLSLVAPDGTALSLAYSQGDVLPLVQIAAVTGICGIGFLVTLVPSGIHDSEHPGERSRASTPRPVATPLCALS